MNYFLILTLLLSSTLNCADTITITEALETRKPEAGMDGAVILDLTGREGRYKTAKIKSLEGIEQQQSLSVVTQLFLSNNNITTIRLGHFVQLGALKVLDLSSNFNLKSITDNAFTELKHLQKLNVNNCYQLCLNKQNMFKNTALTVLCAEGIKKFDSRTLMESQYLKELYLNKTKEITLNPENFSQLESLRGAKKDINLTIHVSGDNKKETKKIAENLKKQLKDNNNLQRCIKTPKPLDRTVKGIFQALGALR